MTHFPALILAIWQITISFGGPPCEALETAKKQTYGFRPSSLDKAQREQKSRGMDEFWKLAKQLGPGGVKCLGSMLKEEKEDGFFLFDGAALLYSLDQSEGSTAAVQDAVLRSSFADVEPAGYIRLVLNLSHHGADVGPLAMKYLNAAKVDTYLPQHGGMKLDRLGGGVILFGSMQPSQIDKYLPQAVSADKPEIRSTAAMLLAFNMTEEAFKSLKPPSVMQMLSVDTRKQVQEFTRYTPVKPLPRPLFSREQVLKIIRRMPHTREEFEALQPEYMKYREAQEPKLDYRKLNSKELAAQLRRDAEEGEPFFGIAGAKRFEESAVQTLTEADLTELREARRKSVEGVSDETLDEYFAYSRIILGLINRLDLYKEFRSH